MLDKEKVLSYMLMTEQKKALIRKDGRYYYVVVNTNPGNNYTDPYEYVTVTEVPPPIEILDL